MRFCFSKQAYFLRLKDNVNFTKTCFLSEAACLCINILRHKSLLDGTTH